MAFDGMATPLGMKPGNSRRGVPSSWRWGMLALFAACVVGLAFASGVRFSPRKSAPGVVALIERPPPTLEVEPPPPAPEKGLASPTPNRAGMAEIEANSGVNVVRQNGGSAPGGVVIKVPEAGGERTAAMDSRVAERSAVGILPRISDSGLLPRLVYARPFLPSGKPRIGVVLTGVGIGARGTADAITRLPGEITLAFAPYGRDLENQVARARRDGHEIMLQIPMEPQDYPESDPGPHTLRTASNTRENIERLHWLMSRFQGYVGVTNFLGARLMADSAAYAGVLEEINRRGLLFLDDGTAPRSRTQEITRRINLPAQTADRIYETGSTKSLEKLLAETEELARKNGTAILSVPALPANIDKLVQWERDLAARGLVLAPLSAIIDRAAR
jgi:uncharacterized protein